ncbi:MAG: cardiolipin synthase [Patescibacteria group bacterium]
MLRAQTARRTQQFNILIKPVLLRLQSKNKLFRQHLDNFDPTSNQQKLMTYLDSQELPLFSAGNKITILDSGEKKFSSLLHDLKTAKNFIHMQYFIWKGDILGNRIAEILMHKARQGVEVRILVDFLGSFTFISPSYITKLKQAGVNFEYNQKWWNILQLNRQNYRDHRKIVVIDGKVGYFGGINVGQEYIDGGDQFTAWTDAHVKIEGEGVNSLQLLFSQAWYLVTGESLLKPYFDLSMVRKPQNSLLDIVVSGPTQRRESIKQLYISLILNAKKRIWIASPYFVPDSTMQESLAISALSGVDVRLVITGQADNKIPFWAAHNYYPNLLAAGVKIYEYKAGFLHSKVLVCDDNISCVGSLNLDNRSFRLNFELSAVMYEKWLNTHLADVMEEYMAKSQPLDEHWFNKLPNWIKLRNALAALLSPIL